MNAKRKFGLMRSFNPIFILVSLTMFISAACATNARPLSDHYDGKYFYNQTGVKPGGFSELLKWQMGPGKEKWPDQTDTPIIFNVPASSSLDKMIVTFVSHSTFLIQVDGFNILTDPHWNERASPFSFAGPRRVYPPAILFENLPKIDIVLISHNHYDHMDAETIAKLEKKFSPHFIVPLENLDKMKSFGASNVTQIDWWESINVSPDFKITLAPAQHWSSRTPFDRNQALWGSFFIESKKEKIYFAGDTGYGPHFKEIQKKLGSPTLAFLPIGAYAPRWFMKDLHLNPEDAVLAHLDLNSNFSLGMHFGTFQLSDEAIDTPLKDLQMAMEKLKVNNFKAPSPGEVYSF